jgi:alanine-glyoxylate transaminase/serine-glyoxylate transaminase/serine-pyruvate transaminase
MISSFNPPRRVLMGPGPSDVHPRVLQALARPTVGHLDPEFIRMMDEMKALLQYAFKTGNDLTIPVSGPGSAGMETCFVNLLEPGDKVVVCVNGVFGGRMKENIERCGAEAVVVEDAWGTPVDASKAEAALKANPGARALAFVHAETSTGVESDAARLCGLARKYGALSIVDTVTSLGGIPVLVDEWGADAVYSGSQKCLSCTSGLSPVTFGARAVERLRGRNRKVQSWFMDLTLVMGYWGAGAKRAYHHAPRRGAGKILGAPPQAASGPEGRGGGDGALLPGGRGEPFAAVERRHRAGRDRRGEGASRTARPLRAGNRCGSGGSGGQGLAHRLDGDKLLGLACSALPGGA